MARETPCSPLQRHLGAWPRDTACWAAPRRRPRPFNVTSALGRGIHRRPDVQGDRRGSPSTSPRRLAEGYRAGRRDRAARERPSTSPRRLAEGYLEQTAYDLFQRGTLQRHLGAWPRDTCQRNFVCLSNPSSLQRHLGAWPRDTPGGFERVRERRGPSTSPRRLAEGYQPLDRSGQHRRRPSTSPRRLAEGYPAAAGRPTSPAQSFNVTSALGRGIQVAARARRLWAESLQRHLGAWPRDTCRT